MRIGKKFDEISEEKMQNLVNPFAHVDDNSKAILNFIRQEMLLNTINNDLFENNNQIDQLSFNILPVFS